MTCCCIVRDQYHSWREGDSLIFDEECYNLRDIEKWQDFANWRLEEKEFYSEMNKFYWKDFLNFLVLLKEAGEEKEALADDLKNE